MNDVDRRRHRESRPDTPANTLDRRPKTSPTDRTTDTHDRVRRDMIDDCGAVTLRVNGRLRHIGVGRTHARTPVILLVHDRVVLVIRVVDTITGELLRDLTIDPRRDYQPNGRQPRPANNRKNDS